MEELEPTWGCVIRVWWLLVWRTTVGAFVLGSVAGGVFGSIAALANWHADAIQLVGMVIGAAIGALWGIVVVGMALKKRYRNFRIALVPASQA